MTRKKQPATGGPSGPSVPSTPPAPEPDTEPGSWWTVPLDDTMSVRLLQLDPQTKELWYLADLPLEYATDAWIRENLGAALYKAQLIGDKIDPSGVPRRRVVRQTYGPFRIGGARVRQPTDPLPGILGKSPEYLDQPAAARGDGGPGPAAAAIVSERALTPREALDAALVKQTLEVVNRAAPPPVPTDWAKIAVAFAPLLERVLAGRAAPADPVLEELKALRGSLEATRGKGAASTKELSEMLELVDRIRGRVGAGDEEDDAAEALAIEGVPDWVPAIVRVVDRLTAPKRAPEPAPAAVQSEARGDMDPMTAQLLEGARALWREAAEPSDAARRLLEAVPVFYHRPLWHFLSDPQALAYLQAWAPDLFSGEDRRGWTLELMRALHVQARLTVAPSPPPVEES